MCVRFRSHILYKRNFSDQWISSADSVCTSNICDHATSKQHSDTMTLLQKEAASAAGQSLALSGPIVVALNSLPEDEKLRHKFDIAYFLAMEKFLFESFLVSAN